MKKNKLKFILLVILIPLLTYCGGVKDALEGKKRSEQNDEFLVKKKNPLQMPPDMNKLPTPGDDLNVSVDEDNDEVKNLLKIKDKNDENISEEGSDLLNDMKKKIQLNYSTMIIVIGRESKSIKIFYLNLMLQK